jgi:putative serine protease PepD
LVESNPADRPAGDEPPDSRYFGPFGEPPVDYRFASQAETQPPELTHAAPSGAWPPPDAFPGGPPPTAAPPAEGRRRARPLALIGVAAVTALLVGGGAGYGGALLAERNAAPVASPGSTSSAPAPGASPSPSGSSPEPVPPGGTTIDTVAVAKRALPGTVTIQVGRSTGSGFVIDDQGRIMTNNHVVAGAPSGATIRVSFTDGRRQTATLVGRSPSYDLAVLKVKPAGYLRPVELGNSDTIQVGEPVLAIGAPLGLTGSVTQGIVSAQNRPVVVQSVGDADAPYAFIDGIQTDASINPGNSGGPLVDARGRVIGVTSAILTRGNSTQPTANIGLAFAIPINQAKTIGDLLITNGKATYPVIGASLREVTDGLVLTAVDRDGPASRAGLRVGDRITKIDDRRVSATEELIVEIRTHRPGEKVVLEYSRGNANARATVTLGSREG